MQFNNIFATLTPQLFLFLSAFNFFDDNHYTLDFLPIHIILTHMRKTQVNHFPSDICCYLK